MAEMEGFEPPHALRRLADFESAPFSHLGTSPDTRTLYQRYWEKSRLFPAVFCQFQNFFHFLTDACIALPTMGTQTSGTVLNSSFRIPEVTAAVFSQAIQRTITENTAE